MGNEGGPLLDVCDLVKHYEVGRGLFGSGARVVRAVAVEGPASPGDAVIADGVSVGVLTSVAVDGAGRSRAIVRVRWDARSADLRTASGAAVSPA